LSELAWTEVRTLDRVRAVAILPLGAICVIDVSTWASTMDASMSTL